MKLKFILIIFLLLMGMKVQAQKKDLNLVVITVDGLSRRVLMPYGDTILNTQNIDLLASRSIVFDSLNAASANYKPNLISFLTGLLPTKHGYTGGMDYSSSGSNDVEDNKPNYDALSGQSISGLLLKRGYTTKAIGKLDFLMDSTPGNDHFFGFETITNLLNYNLSENAYGKLVENPDLVNRYLMTSPFITPNNLYNQLGYPNLVTEEELTYDELSIELAGEVLQYSNKVEKPFYLHLALDGAGENWYPRKGTLDRVKNKSTALPSNYMYWRKNGRFPFVSNLNMPFVNQEQIQNSLAGYYAKILELDDQVGNLLNYLDENQLWENTIILFFGATGNSLYERGIAGSNTFFQENILLPGMLYHPYLTDATRRKTQPVSILALKEFLLPLLQTDDESSVELKMKELRSEMILLQDYSGPINIHPEEQIIPKAALITDGVKIVYTLGTTGQLYDLKTDPAEKNNLWYGDTLSDFRNQAKIYLANSLVREGIKQFWADLNKMGDEKSLVWEDLPEASSYVIYSSKVNDPFSASKIAEVYSTSYPLDEELRDIKGFYWIEAKIPLLKVSEQSGGKPAGIDPYKLKIPISSAIKVP
jgi:choline-sulfatase